MKSYTLFFVAAALLIGPTAFAQEIEKVQPSGRSGGVFLAMPGGLARELAETTRDIITVRDEQWTILTVAQIGAAIADAKTSLNNFHACPTCLEVGTSRYFVGSRPDAHKYIVAGAVEIALEAVTAHFLRNHIPRQKWYWRLAWTLPQSVSLYGHADSAYRNTRVNLGCYTPSPNCP